MPYFLESHYVNEINRFICTKCKNDYYLSNGLCYKCKYQTSYITGGICYNHYCPGGNHNKSNYCNCYYFL